MEHYVSFNCYDSTYTVKYDGNFIPSNVIEERLVEFYNSDEYNEGTMSDKEVIEKVMSTFNDVSFEFVETQYVDAVWCHDQN